MFAALLALAPLQAPDEVTPAWEQAVTPTTTAFRTLLELDGEGPTLVLATRTDDESRVVLERLAPDGTTLWSRDLSLADGARFMDLALTDDGARALVLLADGGGGTVGQRVLSFDGATGVPGWSREFGPLPLAVAHHGRLDVASGTVALVRSGVLMAPPGSNDWTAEFRSLDAASGADIAVGATFFGDERPEVSLAPDGAAALVWEVDGTSQVVETADASVRWALDVPTSPSPSPLDSGVTAAVFDATGTVVVRTDGVRTVAADAADGSFRWAYDYVDARDVVRVGSDRLFVCGVEGFGTTQGAPERYAMLDAATGVELWAGELFDPATTSSALFIKRNHAAVDEAAGLVAFRDKDLHVFDVATGAPVGTAAISGTDGSGTHLERLPGGGWVGSTEPVDFFGGVVAEAFDGAANPLWSTVGLDEEPSNAVLLAVEAFEAADRTHTAWQVDPPGEAPRYEVRSLDTGALISDWALPFSDQAEATWATSPDGARVASFTEGQFSVPVRVQDALTGDLVWDLSISGGVASDDRDLAWSPGAGPFATIWRSVGLQSFVLRRFEATAPIGWVRTVEPGPGEGTEVGDPTVSFEPDGAALLVTHRTVIGGDPALRVQRWRAADGVDLGSFVWDDATTPSAAGGHTVLSTDVAAGTGQAYLTLLSDTGGARYVQVLAVDLASMTVTNSRVVVPASAASDYTASGVALAPDGTTLALVGGAVGAPPVPGPRVRLDVLELPSLTTRVSSTWANGSQAPFGEVAYLNAHAIAVRHGGLPSASNPSATLELFDAGTGQSLDALDDTDGLPLSGTLTGGFALDGEGAVLFGHDHPGTLDLTLERLAVAPLLAGPNTVASGAGGPVEFTVDVGPERAGDVWLLLGSASGTRPGTPVGGVVVPLQLDGYTLVALSQAGQGPWTETLGMLDADGAAPGAIALPPFSPALAGTVLHHAAVVFSPSGALDLTTQPVAFTLVL